MGGGVKGETVSEVVACEFDVGVIDLSAGPGVEVGVVIDESDAVDGIGVRARYRGQMRETP